MKTKLEWLFDLYDADDTNYITFWELYMFVRILFLIKSIDEDPYQKTFDFMKLFDKNNDQKITKNEFVRTMMTDKLVSEIFKPY